MAFFAVPLSAFCQPGRKLRSLCHTRALSIDVLIMHAAYFSLYTVEEYKHLSIIVKSTREMQEAVPGPYLCTSPRFLYSFPRAYVINNALGFDLKSNKLSIHWTEFFHYFYDKAILPTSRVFSSLCYMPYIRTRHGQGLFVCFGPPDVTRCSCCSFKYRSLRNDNEGK